MLLGRSHGWSNHLIFMTNLDSIDLEMMADAWERGVKHIVLGIGGSATCDAGMGMLEALKSHRCLSGNTSKEVLPQPLSRCRRHRLTDIDDIDSGATIWGIKKKGLRRCRHNPVGAAEWTGYLRVT